MHKGATFTVTFVGGVLISCFYRSLCLFNRHAVSQAGWVDCCRFLKGNSVNHYEDACARACINVRKDLTFIMLHACIRAIMSEFIAQFVFVYIYLPLPQEQDATQGQFFKQSSTDLNSEFSLKTNCRTKAEEPQLPYHLPITGGRIIGFILFPMENVNSFIQDLNSCRCIHFLWRYLLHHYISVACILK